MKNLVSVYVISIFFFSCAPSKSIKTDHTTTVKQTPRVESKYIGPKRRIGVVEFENKTVYGQRRLGQVASDILVTELVKSDRFIVIEREKLNKIMEEQRVQQSGTIDPQTAVRLGQILGLEAIVVGAITEFGVRKEGSDYLLAQSKQQVAEANVDIRVIDVETGQVILADSGKGITKSKKATFLGMGTKGGYDETIEGEALRAAIVKFVENIVNQLNKKPWSATIADAYGDEIYINAGANSNVNIGLKISCYSQDKEIRDPKSNLIIGYREEYIGDFEIVRYCGERGDCSIAKAIKMNKSPKSGDICRIKN